MAELNDPITERELEIVRLVSVGITNKEIAAQLSVSPNTVKVHLNNIFTKLGLHTRTELTVHAIRSGWVASGANEIAAPMPSPAPPETALPADAAPPFTEAPANIDAAPAQNNLEIIRPNPAENAISQSSLLPALFIPISPKVAPNPHPLPKLERWRKIAMVGMVTMALVGTLLNLPTTSGVATSGGDGINVGDVSNNGFLSPGETTRWFQRAALPAQRARAAAVATNNNQIYVIGGEINQTASGEVLLFQRNSNNWRGVGAPKPTPIWNTVASAVGNLIYVAGGTTANNVATNRLEAYDTVNGIWKVLAVLPRPTTGHSMASSQNQLFVFGGKVANSTTANSYVYDIASDTWRAIAPLPTPRSLTAAVAINDRIFVVGGYDNGLEANTCEVYTPTSNTWATCAPMLIPRGGFGLLRVGNTLYAIGGGQAGFVGFNERYDPDNNRWSAFETPLTGNWRNIAVAATLTEFYVIGGYSNNQRLALTYVYEVFNNRTFLPELKQTQANP